MLHRITIAVLLLTLFGLAFFFFIFWMPPVIEDWAAADKELNAWEQLACQLSDFFAKYWYLPAFATLVGVVLALCVPIPAAREGE